MASNTPPPSPGRRGSAGGADAAPKCPACQSEYLVPDCEIPGNSVCSECGFFLLLIEGGEAQTAAGGMGLTRRQRECLDFIERYSREHGFAPRYEDIRSALGIANKSGAHRLVTQLEERGYVRRRLGERAIEVVRR